MLDGLPRSATVVAMTTTEVTFLEQGSFSSCLQQEPELARHLLSVLAKRLREADEEISATSFLTVKGRLARTLLHLCAEIGKPSREPGRVYLPVKLAQDDLAALVGVVRESINRALRELREDGGLEGFRDRILLVPPILASIARNSTNGLGDAVQGPRQKK
jgi:CRP/FNR family transcriptional regulator, cyclic AMP receptor protein